MRFPALLGRWLFALSSAVLPLSAQGLIRPPTLFLDLGDTGRMRAWLSSTTVIPPSAARAFAEAVGCPQTALQIPAEAPRLARAECAAAVTRHGLQWSAEWDFTALERELSKLGYDSLEISINHSRSGFSRLISPVRLSRTEGLAVSYHGLVALSEPGRIRLEAGVEEQQIWRAAAMAGVILLLPLFLLPVRGKGLLITRAATDALFCAGATAWLCVALPLNAALPAALPWKILGFSLPMLAAVWIGSRIAGGAQSDALFWRGMRAVTLLTLFAPFFGSVPSIPYLLIWTFCCVAAIVVSYWRMRRARQFRLQPLPQGELLTRIHQLASRAGTAVKSVQVLAGADELPAAFATRYRGILLSSGLLRTLSRREVDAIVCHELSHLRHPGRAMGRGAPFLLSAVIAVAFIVPSSLPWIPLFLPAAFLLQKSTRRRNEFVADTEAVIWSGDPEALISGLVRVTASQQIPLEWPAWVKPLMAHPSTMERVRIVASRSCIQAERFQQLLSPSEVPPADVYQLPGSPAVTRGVFDTEDRKRLNTRLSLVALATPIAFGVSAPFLGYLPALIAGILAGCLIPEWILWRTRMRARANLAGRPGVFSGFSPSEQPRIYDGSYDYDWGFAAFEDDFLVFRGGCGDWRVAKSEIESIRLAGTPPGWLPRPFVSFRLKSGTALCLRPFDRSFGPAAAAAASRLLARAVEWHTAAAQRAAAGSVPDFSSTPGYAPPQYSWRILWRALPRYGGITLVINFLIITTFSETGWTGVASLLGPVGITWILTIFMAYPNLRRGRDISPSPSTPLASAQPDR